MISSMMKMHENVDYELIPTENEFWQIRILSGHFVETVIQYGTLKVVDDHLKFNFDIISSPIVDLDKENKGLQSVAKDILFSLLEDASA